MSSRAARLLALVVGIFFVSGPGRGAAAPSGSKAEPPTLGVLVAQTFLRAVVDRDLETARPLLARAVSFDGQRVIGGEAVSARLRALFRRMGTDRRLRRVVVMTLAQAVERFGPPPARLKLERPPGGRLLVGLGRLGRGGLVVVLASEGDLWRVVALTD